MTRQDFIKHAEASQREFRRFLTGLCCGNSQLADDIAQESLIKAYLSIGSLSDYNRFSPWLYKIGYTTLLNHMRGKRKMSCYKEAEDLASSESADSAFRYQALYSALERLSPTERSSILLFYMEGYSIKEIARIENVSESAVKQHLSRGRLHLRDLLNR